MRAVCMLWLLATLALPAPAQQVTQEPSPALACLTPAAEARGLPQYPKAMLGSRRHGLVKVQLNFTSADRQPDGEVLEHEGGQAFLDAVEEHVHTWRVPCLDQVGGRARLAFEFVFRPDDRVVVPRAPVDSWHAAERDMLACVVNASGSKAPDYPIDAQRIGIEGRVVARLRFESATEPPSAELYSGRGAERLQSAVEDWVRHYRMPCHSGAPVTSLWTFMFHLDGNKPYGFKPMSLLSWMRQTKDLGKQTLQVDTTKMGCPFELQVRYLQPALASSVAEIDSYHPARGPLLDWLAQSELKLARRQLDSVFGDTAILSVPCMKLDLKPKE
jgi:hypothetical protein